MHPQHRFRISTQQLAASYSMDSDSRQGVVQFPASFPDTFKNFFSMVNEEEDHDVELYSSLLEDKIIPRSAKARFREYSSAAGSSRRTSATHGRSSSFRMRANHHQQQQRQSLVDADADARCRSKHRRYCGMYQDGGDGSGRLSVAERLACGLVYNVSDDEKRRKQFGNVIEHADDADRNDASSDYCDDSDTVSTTSSNNTCSVPYSFLLRHPHHPSHDPAAATLTTPSVPIHHLTRSSSSMRSRRGSVKKLHSPSGSHAERHIKFPEDIAESAASTPSPTDQQQQLRAPSVGIAPSTSSTNAAKLMMTSGGVGPTTIAAQRTGVLTQFGACTSMANIANSTETTAHTGSGGSGGSVGLSVDKINLCSCKPSDLRAARSPVPGRRRASSIATTTAGFQSNTTALDHRYARLDDDDDGGGGDTVRTGGRSSGRYSIGSTEILHSRFGSIHCKSPIPSAGPRACASVQAFHVTGESSGATSGCAAPSAGGPSTETPTLSRQRQRTSSMPVENRKPRLADTRRSAIHCADMDLEYYRLRSFSITSHGICNLGDSMRKRRSVTSVTSTGTVNSEKNRNNSNASQVSQALEASGRAETDAPAPGGDKKAGVLAFKVAMLGESGVGKTALTYQFTTSDYICAYDLSLDEDYGQKTVSVLLNGQETDLEIIDHPACEMSTEAFCSTYSIDIFVVVYSVVDRSTFEAAEKVLHYLKDSEMLLTRGAILVGNKTDLERHREVSRHSGRHLAKEVACKFIETSSGLDHNVNELLVGIVAQVKLNPLRFKGLTEKQKLMLNTSTIQKHRKSSPTSTASVVHAQPMQRRNATNSTPMSTYGQRVVLSIKQASDDDQVFNDDDVQASPSRHADDARHSPKRANDIEAGGTSAAASTPSKISMRTKYLLTSFLKFKRTLRSKRRNSGSCSDLFVI